MFSGAYGVTSNELPWPLETAMVYRLTIDNGTPGDYQFIRNNFKSDRAELKFINQVKISPEATEIKMEMFISYSPCNKCANELIDWIKNLREQGKTVSIAIKFSTFYKDETDGLILLRKEGEITLDVFRGKEDWKHFFQFIKRNDFKKYEKRIRQRRGREDDDYNKLQGII